jgi:hypothetical protein
MNDPEIIARVGKKIHNCKCPTCKGPKPYHRAFCSDKCVRRKICRDCKKLKSAKQNWDASDLYIRTRMCLKHPQKMFSHLNTTLMSRKMRHYRTVYESEKAKLTLENRIKKLETENMSLKRKNGELILQTADLERSVENPFTLAFNLKKRKLVPSE